MILLICEMILVVQNGLCDTRIMDYLDTGQSVRLVKSFEQESFDRAISDLSEIGIVLILGGMQTVREIDQRPELQRVIVLIARCIESAIPIVGICLGAQLIAHQSGCQICPLDIPKCDYETTLFGLKHIFRFHSDYVIPSDSINVIESFEGIPYVFRHKTHNIVGIQAHPDIKPDMVNLFVSDSSVLSIASDHSDKINNQNKHILDILLSYVKKN